MRTVFISGSASIYDPWRSEKAETLVQHTADQLVAKGFTVVSGYGQGVGPFVLNGVLSRLEAEGTRHLNGRLILRPFPIGLRDEEARKRRWTEYRKAILSEVGVAIFLFGNKLEADGTLAGAEGMVEEFELAAANKIYVIPVGVTGSTAKLLFDRVQNHFDRYFPERGFKHRFHSLASTRNPMTLARQIVELVVALRDAN